MRHRVLALSLLACVHCGAVPSNEDAGLDGGPPPPQGKLTIGTGRENGDEGFVPFEDGARLPLVSGAQGGFHVFINVRLDAEGATWATTTPFIERLARRVATNELVSRGPASRVTLVESSTVAGAFDTTRSIVLFLCPTPIGVPVAGERLHLEVRATRERGSEDAIEGMAELVPVCPDGDQHDYCVRICSG